MAERKTAGYGWLQWPGQVFFYALFALAVGYFSASSAYQYMDF